MGENRGVFVDPGAVGPGEGQLHHRGERVRALARRPHAVLAQENAPRLGVIGEVPVEPPGILQRLVERPVGAGLARLERLHPASAFG